MKKIRVKISGVSPLLLHSAAGMLTKEEGTTKKDNQYIPEEDAAKANYFDATIGCYVPSSHVEACMREAAKNFKQGKSNYKTTIISSVFCEQDRIPLNKQTWDEIDRRVVVVQRNRIVRSRPRYNDWALEFILQYDEARITPKVLQNILTEGGAIKGIGDHRPKFGRFKIEEFEEVE